MIKKESLMLVVLVFVVVLGILGCAQQGTEVASVQAQSYFPHEDGYSWRYVDDSGTSYIITIEGTATIGSDTFQVIKFSDISSGSLGLSSFFGLASSTTMSYWRVDDTGVYIYPSTDLTESYYFFSFPLEINKSWTVYENGDYSQTANVVATENITVPAGTFNCYKINYVDRYGTEEAHAVSYWLGEGAGIVKTASSTSISELAEKNF